MSPQMQRTTPADLLQVESALVLKTATEQATGLAAQLVTAQIRSGQLKSNFEAVGSFKELILNLQPVLEERLMKVSVAMIEASLPKEEVKA